MAHRFLIMAFIMLNGSRTFATKAFDKQNIFVWRFEVKNFTAKVAENCEEYFEDVIKQPKYFDYFNVLERKKYKDLFELSRTEEFISPGPQSMLKAIRANAVIRGKIEYFITQNQKVEIHIDLTSLETSESIASGYIEANIYDLEDRGLMQQKFEEMVNEKFIPKLELIRENEKIISPDIYFEEANKSIKGARLRKNLIIKKITSGIIVGIDEQNDLKRMEENGLSIWLNLAEQNYLPAIDSLIVYYTYWDSNQKQVAEYKEKKERITRKDSQLKNCQKEIQEAQTLLKNGNSCTQILIERYKSGLTVTDEDKKRCYNFEEEGLNQLRYLKETGCPDAIDVMIDFYSKKKCKKCADEIKELENEKKTLSLQPSRH